MWKIHFEFQTGQSSKLGLEVCIFFSGDRSRLVILNHKKLMSAWSVAGLYFAVICNGEKWILAVHRKIYLKWARP